MSLEGDLQQVTDDWDVAHSFENDQFPEDKGEVVKTYEYGTYKEVIVTRYKNGAEVYNTVTGHKEWFNKNHINDAFEMAKTLSGRYRTLNRLMG